MMTEKTSIDDIIGIVKTDEVTDSVTLKKEAQLSICEKRVLELEMENEQLKQQHRQLQIEFNDACGIVHDLKESKLDLEDENEQLLKEKIDAETKLYKANEKLLMQMDYDAVIKQNEENEVEIINLKKENEQLKKEVEDLKQALIRCAFDER